MQSKLQTFFPKLAETIQKAQMLPILEKRKETLKVLIQYIQNKLDQGQEINLNFICTHNSRRSQFSQIWAKTAAELYGIPANTYSGGVEVTAFNSRAVTSQQRWVFNFS